MKLIVGLGNPGKKYENTRHNMGYRVIDKFADLLGLTFDRSGFSGDYTIYKNGDENIILLKPTTFMNLSGNSVREIKNYFHIDTKDILVVYDDMALNPGIIRIKEKGSSGGQKGIQNIIDNLQTEEIKRIRIGIGEPPFDGVDYVLSRPSKEEEILIDEATSRAALAIKEFIKYGLSAAISKYSGGKKD